MKGVLIERSLPIVAGMVSELAEVEKPPAPVVLAARSFTKSNLNAASGRRAILPISVGVVRSCSMRLSWAEVEEKAIAERMKSREIMVEEGEEGERLKKMFRRWEGLNNFHQHSTASGRGRLSGRSALSALGRLDLGFAVSGGEIRD